MNTENSILPWRLRATTLWSLLTKIHDSHLRYLRVWHNTAASYQVPMEPLNQTVSCRVGDLATQTFPFLRVHHFQDSPQVFQKVKRPQVTHERRCGRLAVKQTIGVIQRLWTWSKGTQKRLKVFNLKVQSKCMSIAHLTTSVEDWSNKT